MLLTHLVFLLFIQVTCFSVIFHQIFTLPFRYGRFVVFLLCSKGLRFLYPFNVLFLGLDGLLTSTYTLLFLYYIDNSR